MQKTTIRALCAAALLSVSAFCHASVAYTIERQLPTGDTIGLVGLADNGDILLSGYGDLCFGGKSSIVDRGGSPNGGFVRGLPAGNPAQDITCGVSVAKLNSAGDMLGSSIKNGTTSVPTLWLAGVAFDLTDPANAGLGFTADPGSQLLTAFDINSLVVTGAPSWFTADYRAGLSSFAWTNARGEFALESRRAFTNGLVLVPVAVSTPATLPLVAAALGVLLLGQRRRAAPESACHSG